MHLFYREPRVLSDEDRTLLETIASLLPGAIEGLRAAALQRETAIAEGRGVIVRELLVHLRTRTNREDIAPALKTTLQKFEHETGLATHLEIEGEGMPLPADVQVQVLHVV